MDTFRIRTISEADVDEIVSAAGGRRAHPNADSRSKPGADYLFEDCVIELKILDDDGLAKVERQQKLAGLFRPLAGDCPVVVLDRDELPKEMQRTYDRILEGPIKTAVSSARAQLKQSRSEILTKISLLWVVNNGYTALDHESLIRMVSHRVRNDTAEIDGVILSGCYFHSDTFDSFFLWPIDYEPLNLKVNFGGFARLRKAWNDFAQEQMTELIRNPPALAKAKGPVIDSEFEVDGVTYVKPAPPIGKESEFFINGRPRKNTLECCPSVATVMAELTEREWQLFSQSSEEFVEDSYVAWRRVRGEAGKGTLLAPLVSISVTKEGWDHWTSTQGEYADFSPHRYATAIFESKIRELLRAARDIGSMRVKPSRYVLIISDEIGQNASNDLAHAAIVSELDDGQQKLDEIFSNQRLQFGHALALACAYALVHSVDVVLWGKDRRYAWQ